MSTNHVTEEVRYELVLAVLRNEKSQSELARQQGISDASHHGARGAHAVAISKWVKRFLESGKEGLRRRRNGRVSQREQQLEAENEELKKAIGELSMENRILKKVQRLSSGGRN